MAGRPTKYTLELADLICERLAAGESMRAVSRDEDMPAMSTLFKWLREKDGFSEQYTHAKECGADAWADKIAFVADGVLDGDYDPQAARVAIDGYKWTASKLKPKVYGDKQHIEHSGGVNDLSDEQLDERIAKMMNGDA